MAVNLAILFVGMVGFAKKGAGVDRVVHGVLPGTGHHQHAGHGAHEGYEDTAGHAIPPHRARVHIVSLNGLAADGWLGPALPFDGAVLSISARQTARPEPELPGKLLNVGELVGGALPEQLLRGLPDGDLVHARVELALPGTVTSHVPTRFTIRPPPAGEEANDCENKEPYECTDHDTCTLWVHEDARDLRVVIRRRHDAGVVETDLTPSLLDGARDVWVLILVTYIPADQTIGGGRRPRPGERIKHFPAYYPLVGDGVDLPIPHYEEELRTAADARAAAIPWMSLIPRGGETSSCPNALLPLESEE